MKTAANERITVAGVEVSPHHFIDGKRVASSRRFTVISPIDETVLGEVSAGGKEEVDMAVKAAAKAFPEWAALGPKGRGPLLRKLADIIEEHVEELARVETRDNGSLYEASRLRVMKRGANNIRFFADFAEEMERERWSANGVSYEAHYDPAGVAGLITPWNAPFMLSTWKVGPALAAGNTVVLKPPEWAPFTCSLLADFAQEAGLPPGVFNVVQGIGEEAGAALVDHPGVVRLSFTGSVETGQLIAQKAGQRLVPVSLELGGKSPLIIFEDCDYEAALKTALGQYDNAGQVCLAGTRILVQESMAERFLEDMKQGASRLVLGDPRRPETDVGPLITREHLQRVQGFVERAIAQGAKLVYGGKVSETLGGLYFEPTLFTDVPSGAEILKKEVFGPVLTLQTFKTVEEAVHMANDTDYGLAATIFTKDEAKARRVAGAVVAGTVWVNTFYARHLAVPFGGSKISGIGREGGRWSLDFFCDVKTLSYREDGFLGGES